MELKYNEIKEDSIDIYESLHIRSKYTLNDTFYAFMSDYELNENYDKIEKTAIYVSFTALLIAKSQDFEFLRSELVNLISSDNIKESISNLEPNDSLQFCKDVDTIKKAIY